VSEHRPPVTLDLDSPQAVEVDEVATSAPLEPAADGPRPGSLLARLHAERDELIGDASTVVRVGRHTMLAARYRALTQDEQADIAKREQRRTAQLRRAGLAEKLDVAAESAALTLARACVELLWVEDGSTSPAVAALAADGVDTQGAGALRYDRRSAQVLGLDLGEQVSSVEVVLALHEFSGSHMPVFNALAKYSEWLNGERDAVLDELLDEGN